MRDLGAAIVLRRLGRYLIPPGVVESYRAVYSYAIHRRYFPMLAKNSRFRDRHLGKRCFIVCNGPSINTQNLRALKGEIVISVSSGYHHPDFQEYSPLYHCVPQFTMPVQGTEELGVKWIREMHSKIGSAEIFHSIREAPLIKKYGLYSGRNINYLCMEGSFSGSSQQKIDITRIVPGVHTVPIMALMIGIYMGFGEIYLIGTDHDSYRTRVYNYFYDPSLQFGGGVSGFSGPVDTPVSEELLIYYKIFMQYRALLSIGVARGISIFNATRGGALEELPRVDLEEVLCHATAP